VKRIAVLSIAALFIAAPLIVPAAQAASCIKGALAGGVARHYVAYHSGSARRSAAHRQSRGNETCPRVGCSRSLLARRQRARAADRASAQASNRWAGWGQAVKTPEDLIKTLQKSRGRGLGESLMRAKSSTEYCAEVAHKMAFTRPRAGGY
jgi:hypothetical protein